MATAEALASPPSARCSLSRACVSSSSRWASTSTCRRASRARCEKITVLPAPVGRCTSKPPLAGPARGQHGLDRGALVGTKVGERG